VFVACAIGIALLITAAFLAWTWLTSERWAMGYEYLAWIFGLGSVGLISLCGAVVIGNKWRRANLIARPQLQIDKYELAVVSGVSGLFLITSVLFDFLLVGISPATLGAYLLAPISIVLLLVSVIRFLLRFRNGIKHAGLPLAVNVTTLGLVLLLYWLNNRLDLGFNWRLHGYTEVVELVERHEIQADERGYAMLPPNYRYLSDGGEIVIIQRDRLTSVLFFTYRGILGEYSAIAYRSDDTIPKNYLEDRCDRAWRVKANVAHWFVCVSD